MVKTKEQLNNKFYNYCYLIICIICLNFIIYNLNGILTTNKIQLNSEASLELNTRPEIQTIKATYYTPIYLNNNMEQVVTEHIEKIVNSPETKSPLTNEEIELLARLIHAEAGNQDEIGKRLVADVVLNRMDAKNISVHDVIYAINQFSTAPYLYSSFNTPTEDEYQIARQESINRYNSKVGYFKRYSYHPYGEPAFVHGAHYFSNLK